MGKRRNLLFLLLGMPSMLFNELLFAAGDPNHGATIFQACAACHSIKPGDHMTGPSLANFFGRKAGTAEGFLRYSDAMKAAKIVWDENTLDKWLSNPARFISRNEMTFPGIRDNKDRQDIIAYLKAASEGKAPSGPQQRGGMMMGGERTNLRQTAADAQVVSLSHCHDTYVVKTAAGSTHKFWEFNLRFKTDTSKYGPAPGKPVIVGAGMRGDRASIVFSQPKEISAFIEQRCD